MKKLFLPAILLLTTIAAFAQEENETHDKYYEFGRKNAVPILIGVVVLIVVIIMWVRSRKNKSEPPQQTG